VKFLRGFYQFWYDFIIGDDWKIAVAVVLALGATAAVMAVVHSGGGSLTGWTVLGGLLVLAFFVVGLLIDSRGNAPKA
jgi:1,4-dihydroxy-2-naphthoate octaprenyltransferase